MSVSARMKLWMVTGTGDCAWALPIAASEAMMAEKYQCDFHFGFLRASRASAGIATEITHDLAAKASS